MHKKTCKPARPEPKARGALGQAAPNVPLQASACPACPCTLSLQIQTRLAAFLEGRHE